MGLQKLFITVFLDTKQLLLQVLDLVLLLRFEILELGDLVVCLFKVLFYRLSFLIFLLLLDLHHYFDAGS